MSNRDHALYRFYDATGQLLYIGITADPGSRWRSHAHDGCAWYLCARGHRWTCWWGHDQAGDAPEFAGHPIEVFHP